LAGCKNYVGELQEFIFNAFINLEPLQRSEDGCDMRRFRSFNHSTCKTVLNLLEAVYMYRGWPKVCHNMAVARNIELDVTVTFA